jgi:hypothetical protein
MMNEIGKHAEFYRAYLPRDRSPLPMTITLATIIALWLFVYLVSAAGPQPGPQIAQAGPRATALAAQPERR